MFSIHLNIQKGLFSCLGAELVDSTRVRNTKYTDLHSTKNQLKMSEQHPDSVYEFHRARFRLPISWWNSPNNMPQLILIYTVSL